MNWSECLITVRLEDDISDRASEEANHTRAYRMMGSIRLIHIRALWKASTNTRLTEAANVPWTTVSE